MHSRSRQIIFVEFMEYCLAWHGQSYTDVIEYVSPLIYRVYRRENNGFKFSVRDLIHSGWPILSDRVADCVAELLRTDSHVERPP